MIYLFLLLVLVGLAIGYYAYTSDRRPGAKSYSSLDEWKKDLKIIWKGRRTVEFTYEKFDESKSRRKVDVKQILKDGKNEIYLRGFCHLRKEVRTFNVMNITTKILDKSQRYEVGEWLAFKLNIEL